MKGLILILSLSFSIPIFALGPGTDTGGGGPSMTSKFIKTFDFNSEFLNEEEYHDGLHLIEEENIEKVILQNGNEFDLIRAKNLFENQNLLTE